MAKIMAKEECKKYNKSYEQPKGIFSTKTYKNYKEICNSFVLWIVENHKNDVSNYNGCFKYAAEWLREKEENGLSAWTLNLYGSALASSFGGLSKSEIGYQFPPRERKDIKRNRGDELNKKYFTQGQKDAVKMLIATGCRRMEILRLRDEDFREQTDSDGNPTGCLEVLKRGKNKISRWCLVSPEHSDFVREFLQNAKTYSYSGEKRLFKKCDIPTCGIHSARAVYAKALYEYYESKGYSSGKIYFCRKELSGHSFDKGILEKVSFDLQHSRNSIVIQYLWMA